MNGMDRLVEVADLDAVAYFGEALVLFIDTEDENAPATLCVEANFDTLKFGPAKPLGKYLESKPYIPVLDVDARISQRQRLLDEMASEAITDMLNDLNHKKKLSQKDLVLLSEMYPGWQPGG